MKDFLRLRRSTYDGSIHNPGHDKAGGRPCPDQEREEACYAERGDEDEEPDPEPEERKEDRAADGNGADRDGKDGE